MNDTPPITDRSLFGTVLVHGFAIALAQWFIAYLGRLPWWPPVSGWVLGPLLLLVLVLGARKAARFFPEKAALVGASAGILAIALDFMMLFSVKELLQASSDSEQGTGLLLACSLLCGGILGLVGGLWGGRSEPLPVRRPWQGAMARVAVASTFVLLSTGGLVTSLEAGLAVPDWPSTYGANMFLYPLSQMLGDIYFEHTHRLFGALVGITTIALLISVLRFDRRKFVWGLAALALVAVISQGLAGAYRVTLAGPKIETAAADPAPGEGIPATPETSEPTASEPAAPGDEPAMEAPDPKRKAEETPLSTLLRVVHGVLGQLTLALLVAIAIVTSGAWQGAGGPVTGDHARSVRKAAAVFWFMLVLQLILGAGYRHTGHVAFFHSHLMFALVVTGLALWASTGLRKMPDDTLGSAKGVLRRSGAAMMHTVFLQLILGVAALIAVMSKNEGVPQVLSTTAHQLIGALLLVWATCGWVWSRRLLAR